MVSICKLVRFSKNTNGKFLVGGWFYHLFTYIMLRCVVIWEVYWEVIAKLVSLGYCLY